MKIGTAMKSAVILTVVVFILQGTYMTPADNKRSSSSLKRIYLDCADHSKAEPEMILMLRSGEWKEDDKLKSWVHCVLVKSDLMTNQSVFQLDVAFQKVKSKEKVDFEKHVDECLTWDRMAPVEIAWRFAKCFQQKEPKHTLF